MNSLLGAAADTAATIHIKTSVHLYHTIGRASLPATALLIDSSRRVGVVVRFLLPWTVSSLSLFTIHTLFRVVWFLAQMKILTLCRHVLIPTHKIVRKTFGY